MQVGPAYRRAADQRERDEAGAAQRRIEASLQRRWISLAEGTGPSWWERLVPRRLREQALRHAGRDAGSSAPRDLVCRLPFRDFCTLFRDTFPHEAATLFRGDENRIQWMVQSLDQARDAAGHPGKPYLAVEAQVAVAVAYEIARLLPSLWHEPADLVLWLDNLATGETEGFRPDDFDFDSDTPLDGVLWFELHQLCKKFKALRAGGDGGFAGETERVLLSRGVDVFMRAGELTMGTSLPADSSLLHELDLGVRDGRHVVVIEMKNQPRSRVTKTDLLVFNQKTIDFHLASVRAGDQSRLLRTFVTTDRAVTDQVRAFCLYWGILLVEPSLMPVSTIVSVLRDLELTPLASSRSEFSARLAQAERLAGFVRPLDRVFVPSSLSRWRLLIDIGSTPSAIESLEWVNVHRALDAYIRGLRPSP